MSLIFAPDKDLISLAKFYSKLIKKTNGNNSLRMFYVNRMRPYTKELKSRGIDWNRRKRR